MDHQDGITEWKRKRDAAFSRFFQFAAEKARYAPSRQQMKDLCSGNYLGLPDSIHEEASKLYWSILHEWTQAHGRGPEPDEIGEELD